MPLVRQFTLYRSSPRKLLFNAANPQTTMSLSYHAPGFKAYYSACHNIVRLFKLLAQTLFMCSHYTNYNTLFGYHLFQNFVTLQDKKLLTKPLTSQKIYIITKITLIIWGIYIYIFLYPCKAVICSSDS